MRLILGQSWDLGNRAQVSIFPNVGKGPSERVYRGDAEGGRNVSPQEQKATRVWQPANGSLCRRET